MAFTAIPGHLEFGVVEIRAVETQIDENFDDASEALEASWSLY